MKNYWIILIASLFMFASCGDKEEMETIYGTWKVESGISEYAEYLTVTEENQLVISYLKNGYKSRERVSLVRITDMQIDSDFGVTEYEIIDNKLILEASFLSSEGILSRASSSEYDNWVKFVKPLTGFDLPIDFETSDIGYSLTDNVFYAANNEDLSTVFKITPTGNMTTIKNLDFKCEAVEITPFGLALAKNTASHLVFIDENSGAFIDNGLSIEWGINCIASKEGTDDVYVGTNNGVIYKYEVITNTTGLVTEITSIEFSPKAMHFFNDHLYIASYNMIYKISIPSFTVVESYEIDIDASEAGCERIVGITRDADKFWIATNGTNGCRSKIRPIILD